MVVWNDTTGVKQELDEGATHKLCQGDELALYMPDNYLFNDAKIDGTHIDRGYNIAIINWVRLN